MSPIHANKLKDKLETFTYWETWNPSLLCRGLKVLACVPIDVQCLLHGEPYLLYKRYSDPHLNTSHNSEPSQAHLHELQQDTH